MTPEPGEPADEDLEMAVEKMTGKPFKAGHADPIERIQTLSKRLKLLRQRLAASTNPDETKRLETEVRDARDQFDHWLKQHEDRN